MIQVTRSLARQLRAVFRKAVPPGWGRGPRPPLTFQADGGGLRVRSHHPDGAVEFRLPGAYPVDQVALPSEALDDFEGNKEVAVVLDALGPDRVQARWDDAGVPQVREYAVPDPEKLSAFPEEPGRLVPAGEGFLGALRDAVHAASRESVRYPLQRLLLRGGKGDVVATDGRQLLIQGGFTFPWKEEVLVPALGAFACREVPRDDPVALGRTEKFVCIRVGPWTFYLGVDSESKFPKIENVIPPESAGATTCRLSDEDAAFLVKALPRLPGQGDQFAPLTIDLNGHVCLRARGEGQSRTTEVILSHSGVEGPPVRTATDRQYLARAVGLGFTEVRVSKPDVPLVCRDARRTYLWMPLEKDAVLPPAEDALRISSGSGGHNDVRPKRERRNEMKRKPPTNGESNGHAVPRDDGKENGPATNGTGLSALIEEAQGLKEALHDAYGRSVRLVAALKRQKKQSRLMASTLASLRQLQQLHPIDA